MFHLRRIESLELPELQPYRTMRLQREHRRQGIFVAEGEKVVRRLLDSNFIVVSLLMPETWVAALAPALQARPEDLPVFVAPKEALETMTGFSMYQGLLAVGRIPAHPSLDEVLGRSARPWLLAAADGLSNAENLGVLARNTAAFGAHALIVGETSASAYLRRAVRSSMGAVFRLPILEPESLTGTLGELRRRGIRCLAAHPRAEGRTLSQENFAGDCCIVFGSEGEGLSAPVLAACDGALSIPMSAEVDSLNVASAAAAFLYEASRQRGRV